MQTAGLMKISSSSNAVLLKNGRKGWEKNLDADEIKLIGPNVISQAVDQNETESRAAIGDSSEIFFRGWYLDDGSNL